MKSKENNYAFIDSQNLNLSIRDLGWVLDFKRFRKYLFDKHGVTKAFLFIGFVEGNNNLYKSLQEAGYICLVKYLIEQDKIKAVLVPNKKKFSALLNFKICRPYLRFMNDLEKKLGYKKKRPHKDGTL